MRLTIFKKAEKLKDKVVCQGDIRGKSFYTFKEIENPPLVTLTCNGKYTYLESCTCTHHGLHGGVTDMKILCAYVLAVYKKIGG